ncbi:MAG: Extracellular solute-binding protein family 1 [Parcubacteria group bacterium GW2011_GWA2_42_14]|nr:MAG: Extracellular solute-binding protein family 1 [Parcubacteria group bacterium GW2011_GWA2_42_14]
MMFGGLIILVLFTLLILSGAIPGLKKKEVLRANLEMWGFKSEALMKDFISRKQDPAIAGIIVKYREIQEEQYESILINALAEGTGPDIFMLKDSQIFKHKNKLEPLKKTDGTESVSAMSAENFKNTFVDATHTGLLENNGEILGLPLFLDTLALFYNKDTFNSANIPNPPQTWDEFLIAAETMSKISPIGDIIESGAALGETLNIEHFIDIISVLIFQSGGEIIDQEKPESVIYKGITEKQKDGTVRTVIPAEKALSFYTSFANPQKENYSWNKGKQNSLNAFVAGDTAMYIGFAKDIPVIKAKNPHLNFGIAPFPQLKGAKTKINYGRFDFLAVSRLSQNKDTAQAYILYITSKEPNADYLLKSGLPPARRDLITTDSKTPAELRVFYGQSLSAKSWLIPDENQIYLIFKDIVESLSSKIFSPSTILTRANDRLNQLLKK